MRGNEFDPSEEPKIKQVFDNLFSHSVHGPFHGNQAPGAQPSSIKQRPQAQSQTQSNNDGDMDGFAQGFMQGFGQSFNPGAAAAPAGRTQAPPPPPQAAGRAQTPPPAPGTMANPIRRPGKFMGPAIMAAPRLKEEGVAEAYSLEESFNMKINELEMMNEDWQKTNRKDKTSGMSRKAVKAYRREHPGSKLQTAVTTKPSKLKKGSKSAKRRASFCARMKGMKKHRTGAKTKRDPNSNINKALRRWHCESVEEMKNLIMIAEQKIVEAKNLKQQAAIAIAKQKAGKSPKK